MKLTNDCFLRVLKREKTDFTPVWLMRQAGRYLPEYRETRAKAGSFMDLAKNPAYATEVTLQPIDRYGLDAAILFSDILTIPDAMGLELDFVSGQGPVFAKPVQSEEAVKKLYIPDPNEELRYVMDAVSSIRASLANRVPLIGFSGSPFTLACYMVEGRGSRDFRLVKEMMFRRPELFERILEVNAQAVTVYLNAQIAAGARAIQIFDTWGGMLADGDYQRFSLAYMKKVLEGLVREHEGEVIPSIIFTKGGGEWLDDMANIGASAVGLDWSVNIARARSLIGNRVAIQGNMDPFALFGDEASIRSGVRRIIDAFGPVETSGHIFNLGHGINQHTPVENVQILVDEVHSYSRQFH